jgi:hypothetical protein
MNNVNHVEESRKYPNFSQGYEAIGASAQDEADLIAAGRRKCDDGKWYANGYGPVRGGWGYYGNNGVGYGPVYR